MKQPMKHNNVCWEMSHKLFALKRMQDRRDKAAKKIAKADLPVVYLCPHCHQPMNIRDDGGKFFAD